MVTASICLLQLAVCTVFVSFIGENSRSFFAAYAPEWKLLSTSEAFNIALAAPAIGGLVLIPNMKSLGPVSEIAIVLLLAAFAVLGVVSVENYPTRPSSLPSTNWGQVPIAICAILYSFEGICIVMPLEASMKQRKKFDDVFSAAYLVVTVVYCCVGSLFVWVFGSVESGSITAFLMNHEDRYEGDSLVALANFLVCASVVGTYPLIMFPCIELRCQSLERSSSNNNTTEGIPSTSTVEEEEDDDDFWLAAYGPYDTPALRLGLVASTFFAALVIPNVRQLIGLAGAIAGAMTALVLPPLLELHFARQYHKGSWSVHRCKILILVGSLLGAVGSIAAISDIMNA